VAKPSTSSSQVTEVYPGEAVEETLVYVFGKGPFVYPSDEPVSEEASWVYDLDMTVLAVTPSLSNTVKTLAYELGSSLVERETLEVRKNAKATLWDVNGRRIEPEYDVNSIGASVDALGNITVDSEYQTEPMVVSGRVSGHNYVLNRTLPGAYSSTPSSYTNIGSSINLLREHITTSFYAIADSCTVDSTEWLFDYPSYYDSGEIWGNTPPESYTNNPDFAYANIDFSGVSTWMEQYDGRSRIATAIAPSWAIMVNHHRYGFNYVIPNGKEIEFLGNDGVAVRRTVIGNYNAPNLLDCHLLKLDSPLPSTVKKYSLWNWKDTVRIMDWSGIPAVNIGQRRNARTTYMKTGDLDELNPLRYYDYFSMIGASFNAEDSDLTPYLNSFFGLDLDRIRNIPGIPVEGVSWAVGGDSSSPVFVLDGTDPVLITLLTGGGWKASGTWITKPLQEWITQTITNDGESVSFSDFSGYKTLLPYHFSNWQEGEDQSTTDAALMNIAPDICSITKVGNYYGTNMVIGSSYTNNMKVGFSFPGYPASIDTINEDSEAGVGRNYAYVTLTNVYLNGPEIFRWNIPKPDPLLYGSVASATMRPLDYDIDGRLTLVIKDQDGKVLHKQEFYAIIPDVDMAYIAVSFDIPIDENFPTAFVIYGSSKNTMFVNEFNPSYLELKVRGGSQFDAVLFEE